MRKRRFLLVAATALLLPSFIGAQTMQSTIETDQGEFHKPLVGHPLTWWTHDPLRLDTGGDLMLGKSRDNHLITSHDYKTEQQIKLLGEVASHRVVQILTTIEPAEIGANLTVSNDQPAVWKDVLVSSDGGRNFVEIYASRYDFAGTIHVTNAVIYGSGENAILGTYDSDTGNGGGCNDGYWWFDSSGPHPVDFSLLRAAVSKAIPKNATFTANCWALEPQHSRLRSAVQRVDAECHACGMLGEVEATYRIEHGVARPLRVVFHPDPQPE